MTSPVVVAAVLKVYKHQSVCCALVTSVQQQNITCTDKSILIVYFSRSKT